MSTSSTPLPAGALTQGQARLYGTLGRLLALTQRRAKPWAWVMGMLLLGGFLALVTAVQPYFTILLLAAALGLGLLIWLLRSLAPGAPWWIKASFFVVCGQLVLNYGFSNIIFFAGGVPIPLTDCVLMIALLYAAGWIWFARDPIRLPVALWLLLVWVLFCLVWQLPSGLSRDGVGAARDAMPTVQMLYVIAGFVVVTRCLRVGEVGYRWLRSVLLLLGAMLAVYGLGYPIRTTIFSLSPSLGSLQQSVPIIGYYTSWPAMGVIPVIGLALWRWQAQKRGLPMRVGGRLLGLIIVVSGLMTFVMLQARVAYVFVAACLPIFLFVGGQAKQAGRMVVTLFLGLAILGTLELSGLELNGRVAKLSLSGIYHHMLSLSGSTASPDSDFKGAAGGINQRKQWRERSLALWNQDATTRVLGIGYGYVLTDLVTGGTRGETLVVREPHNSYVTTLARTGAVGLMVMLTLHASVIACCLAGYRSHRETNPAAAAFFLCALFYEIYCLLNSWGEPHFEVAHFAVPSYFIYGAVFALSVHLVRPSSKVDVNRLPVSVR